MPFSILLVNTKYGWEGEITTYYIFQCSISNYILAVLMCPCVGAVPAFLIPAACVCVGLAQNSAHSTATAAQWTDSPRWSGLQLLPIWPSLSLSLRLALSLSFSVSLFSAFSAAFSSHSLLSPRGLSPTIKSSWSLFHLENKLFVRITPKAHFPWIKIGVKKRITG